MTTSPRVSRFTKAFSDHDLDNAISVPPREITLTGKDFVRQRELLFSAMRQIFVPDAQSRKIIREFIAISHAHAEIHFSSDFEYISGLYNNLPWGQETVPAFCFTGLSGTGKTEILKAFYRLLGGAQRISVAGYDNLPLVATWQLTLRDGVSLNTLLGPHVLPEVPAKGVQASSEDESQWPPKRPKIPEILSLARKIAWRDGVCLLSIDEFQFISQGADANSKATGLLLKLLGIGPRLIYCANFSLVHKLMKRDSQELQRLLTKPIILYPLQASDPDWFAFLEALKSVAPNVLVFDVASDATKIHEYVDAR